jgi:hypothetical protein
VASVCLALVAVGQKSALVARRFLTRPLLMIGAAGLGFIWAAGFAHWRLAEELPHDLEGRDIEVHGVVAGLPQELERGLRFVFDVEQAVPGVPHRISLAWYRGSDGDADESLRVPVRAGERWRFTVRLKRPHGNLNPHGFDYEAWLFERGIRATGYVRPRADAERLEARVWRPGYAVEMLRESIRERFRAALPEAPYAGILIALTIGDQQAIEPELWQSFARTGITHLMSISGLHVTMLAGLAYALVNWLWRRSPRLPLHLPAQKAAALGGLLAAFGYCLLAGFAVPAQRTLYMLGVVALAHLSRRANFPRRGYWRWPCSWCFAARSLGGAGSRLLAVLRCRRPAVPDRRRAAGAGALAGRMVARAMGSDHRHAARAADAVPAVFAGLAAGQCPGDSAGQLRHHAAGHAWQPAAARSGAGLGALGHRRHDAGRRLAGGAAAGGLAAGGAAVWAMLLALPADSGCCCRAVFRHAGWGCCASCRC